MLVGLPEDPVAYLEAPQYQNHLSCPTVLVMLGRVGRIFPHVGSMLLHMQQPLEWAVVMTT